MRPSHSGVDQLWENDENRLRVSISNRNHSVTSLSLIRTAERERWIQSGSGAALNKLLSTLMVSLFLSLTCKRCGPCWAHKHSLTAAIVCRWVNYIPHTVLLSNNSFICLTRTVSGLAPCEMQVIREFVADGEAGLCLRMTLQNMCFKIVMIWSSVASACSSKGYTLFDDTF